MTYKLLIPLGILSFLIGLCSGILGFNLVKQIAWFIKVAFN